MDLSVHAPRPAANCNFKRARHHFRGCPALRAIVGGQVSRWSRDASSFQGPGAPLEPSKPTALRAIREIWSLEGRFRTNRRVEAAE